MPSIAFGADDERIFTRFDPAGVVCGADDEQHQGEDAGVVYGEADNVFQGEHPGIVYGAAEQQPSQEECGVVYGAEDAIIAVETGLDYWAYPPGVHVAACGLTPPDYTGFLVPGQDGPQITDAVGVQEDTIILIPFPNPRARSIATAFFRVGPIHSGPDSAFARFAIYRSRADKCGYPGELLWDGGEIPLAAESTIEVIGLEGAALPAGELLWLATWFKGAADVHHIDRPGVSNDSAWTVLGFKGPDELDPLTGWQSGRGYVHPADGDWPNPLPDGGQPLRWNGNDDDSASFVGLPAVFLTLE